MNPLWTSDRAAAATGGRSTRAWTATGISIDSRTLQPGDLFVALAGPNFNGHAFVSEAFAAGAVAAMVAAAPSACGPLLLVDDTLEALTRLAAAARARTSARIVAVTGSVGKTGVKQAIAHALRFQGMTAASEGSLNNHWGVPLSLARMPAETVFGAFEIGMNHAGEITPLASLARPDAAVVTTVAPAHMAFFDSLEDVARAKAEIFTGLDDGAAIVDRDGAYFDLLADAARTAGAGEVIAFGRHPCADLRLIESLEDPDGADVRICWRGRALEYRVGLPGAHWARNSLAVLAAVHALGADVEQASAAMASLPPMPGRGAVHVVNWGGGVVRLIDDSYNANPESMAAALKTLGRTPVPEGGRRVAILGDMLELGDMSRAAHAGLKQRIERNGIDLVYLAGPEMRALADALPCERVGGIADDARGLMPLALAGLSAGDVVTVKSSKAVGLGRIVDALLERPANV